MFNGLERYAVPQAETSVPFDCFSLLCQSELDNEGGIPDLTEDIFEW